MTEYRRVLIVDDDESIARLFKLILQGKGYLADTAGTGKEALEKISNQPYDVALIDLILPDMNGLDLLRSIPSHTKKIVLTGSTSNANTAKALANGADDYLLKPIELEKLLNTIAKELNQISAVARSNLADSRQEGE